MILRRVWTRAAWQVPGPVTPPRGPRTARCTCIFLGQAWGPPDSGQQFRARGHHRSFQKVCSRRFPFFSCMVLNAGVAGPSSAETRTFSATRQGWLPLLLLLSFLQCRAPWSPRGSPLDAAPSTLHEVLLTATPSVFLRASLPTCRHRSLFCPRTLRVLPASPEVPHVPPACPSPAVPVPAGQFVCSCLSFLPHWFPGNLDWEQPP